MIPITNLNTYHDNHRAIFQQVSRHDEKSRVLLSLSIYEIRTVMVQLRKGTYKGDVFETGDLAPIEAYYQERMRNV